MVLTSSWETAVIAVAAAAFFIARQFQPRMIKDGLNLWLPLILLYLGVQDLGKHDLAAVAGPVLVSSVAAIGTAVLRALTFTMWLDERGAVWVKGTAMTLVLWIILAAIRTAVANGTRTYAPAAGDISAELPLMVALTLGAQQVVLWLRGRAYTSRVSVVMR